MSSEAHEPHAVCLGRVLGGWWYRCQACEKAFMLEKESRPRACPYCGITYTQFKTETGEFEPL